MTDVLALVAVTVTEVNAATSVVVTVNVIVFVPASTVTLAGTGNAALLLDRLTTVPPTGAFAFSVTVPVVPPPQMTVDGLKPTLARSGLTVRT